MIFRVGVSSSLKILRETCNELNAPMLISAGSCYKRKRQKLYVPKTLIGTDVALDSAGFTVMSIHNGVYPWSEEEYLKLASGLNPTWYASRDYCVEPEIAKNQYEITERIDRTIDSYYSLMDKYHHYIDKPPVPVLQGWKPDDYLYCYENMGLQDNTFVGVGSVCRRKLKGPNNLKMVLDALCELPLKFHLFGIKGLGMKYIANTPRLRDKFISTDSHAWDFNLYGEKRNIHQKMEHLRGWYARNKY